MHYNTVQKRFQMLVMSFMFVIRWIKVRKIVSNSVIAFIIKSIKDKWKNIYFKEQFPTFSKYLSFKTTLFFNWTVFQTERCEIKQWRERIELGNMRHHIRFWLKWDPGLSFKVNNSIELNNFFYCIFIYSNLYTYMLWHAFIQKIYIVFLLSSL